MNTDHIQRAAQDLAADVQRLCAAVANGQTPCAELLRQVRVNAHSIGTATFRLPTARPANHFTA